MCPMAVVFACLSGLAVTSAHQTLNNVLFTGDYEFIDLTHPFDNNTVYWPDVQKFVFTRKTEEYRTDGSWYAAKEFSAGEHGGTHLDAPYHFAASGQRIGELPLEKLIVPLIIVDVSSIANDDPNFVLYKRHLDYILNDNLGKPCLVIFKFGWSKYFNDRKKYLGLVEAQDTLNFPGLSSEIAEWITTNYKNIVGIGVDTASADPGSSKDFPVHRIATDSGLYLIENANLNRPIPEYGCTALALPMKIAEGTGAPLRLVAICSKEIPKGF